MSRIKWLGEGDEPYSFFFKLAKAKHQRETLSEILLEDGTLLVIEHNKLKEIYTFYSNLFTTTSNSSQVDSARDKLFSHIKNTLTDRQRRQLIETPILEELRKTLFAFPKNKSSGLDGLTIEVYNRCWPFIANDLHQFVTYFWDTCMIPHKVKDGVIELIPKKPDKQKIQD